MGQLKLTRREALKSALALAIPAWLAACAKRTTEKTLNFFNWSDYIGENTLPGFEKETGIRVQEDLFSDEEEMLAKLKTGVQGYDLTIATDYMIPRLKALGIIGEYPKGGLRNLGNLLPRFRKPDYDPELRYTVPYLWGTTGIAYNKKHVKKKPTSWKDLWDEQYAGRIGMLDNARDGIGIALYTLGLPEESADPYHLEAARAKLLDQKRLLKHYSSATYIDELAAGDLWVAAGWSGDAMQAAAENPDIDYVIPDEGSWMWVDSVCLIANSGRVDDAVRFVDYLLRPEVGQEIAEAVQYATPNEKARALLPKEMVGDTRIFPPDSEMKRLKFRSIIPDEDAHRINRVWQKVKLA